MKQKADSQLSTDALKMALGQRRIEHDLVHHSDRGSQYTSKAYRQLLEDHHIQVSMSAAGNCYDNAMMESFFATLSHALLQFKRHDKLCSISLRFGITGKDGIRPGIPQPGAI